MKKSLWLLAIASIALVLTSCGKDDDNNDKQSLDVTTTAVTSFSDTWATAGGRITGEGEVSERGVCWSTSSNPTVAGSSLAADKAGVGSFSVSITGLTSETKYYVKAYAKSGKDVIYGAEVEFTTTEEVAPTQSVVTTGAVSDITDSGASIKVTIATISSDVPVTERGVYWGTTENPTTKVTHSGSELDFTVPLTGLAAGTKYYVKAYIVSSLGTAYGEVKSFTTDQILSTITTAAQLQAITMNGDYKLGADITLDNTWVPLGTADAPFVGVLNGAGYKITINLEVEPGDDGQGDVVGVFGYVGANAELKNITLEGKVSGANNIGALCAIALPRAVDEAEEIIGERPVFENIINKAAVSGTGSNVGGIIGKSTGAVIRSCANFGTINAEGTEIGGIIGTNTSGVGCLMDMVNCFNEGNVTGSKQVGGMVGYDQSGSAFYSQIMACYNKGNIVAGSYAGGIAGRVQTNTELTACYNLGNVTGDATDYIGGIVGRLSGSSTVTTACYNAGVVSGGTEGNIGAFAGSCSAQPLYCYATGHSQKSGSSIEVADLSPTSWPTDKPEECWGIGNDPETGKFWKNMGQRGTNNYPQLWYE